MICQVIIWVLLALIVIAIYLAIGFWCVMSPVAFAVTVSVHCAAFVFACIYPSLSEARP